MTFGRSLVLYSTRMQVVIVLRRGYYVGLVHTGSHCCAWQNHLCLANACNVADFTICSPALAFRRVFNLYEVKFRDPPVASICALTGLLITIKGFMELLEI